MRNKKEQIVLVLFTIMLIGTGIAPFVEANLLQTTFWLYCYLVLVSLVVSFKLSWYLETLFNGVLIVWVCFCYFPLNHSFSVSWFRAFLQSLVNYFTMKNDVEYQHMPSNLALIIIVFLVVSLVKLILDYQVWLIPFLFIFGYLLILTVFNGNDLTKELIGVVIISLVLSAWLHSERGDERQRFLNYGLITISLISSSYLAWQFPKRLPEVHGSIQMKTAGIRQQAREKGFYQMIEFSRSGSVSTTGFSENDTDLGGPVYPNNQLVFMAKQKKAHYWTVETKDIYTGKGWTVRSNNKEQLELTRFELGVDNLSYSTEKEEISLTLVRPLTYLPKPQGKIIWEVPDKLIDNNVVSFNKFSNRVYLDLAQEGGVSLNTTTFSYYEPSYTIEELEQSQAVLPDSDNDFLQIPSKMPDRIRTLAEKETRASNTDYQKVKAIERYLKQSPEFTYSLESAQRVPNNRDYVDYFLFDAKVGYCQHYSTAMVMMLRSIGIPARWAKGFSEGALSRTEPDGDSMYQITNQNAHAWVEVYFSEIGWVPFEPTKSFTSPEQANLASNTRDRGIENQQPRTSENQPASDTPTSEEAAITQQESELKDKPKKQQGVNQQKEVKNVLLKPLGLVSLLCFGLAGFYWRYSISWYLFLARVKWSSTYTVSKAMVDLNRLLAPLLKQVPSQSIREYVQALSDITSDWQLSLVTLLTKYEEITYGKKSASLLASVYFLEFKQISEVALEQYQKKRRRKRNVSSKL